MSRSLRRSLSQIAWSSLMVLSAACSMDVESGQAPLEDESGARAKVSACLGLHAAAAVTMFWPEQLSGVADGQALESCLRDAASCSEVLSCAGYEAPPCSQEQHCDGAVAVRCQMFASGLSVEIRETCTDALGNSVCSVAEDSKNGLSAFCHGPACTKDHCDGDILVRCRANLGVREDCRRFNQTCIETGTEALCAYSERCTVDFCREDALVLCGLGYVQFDYSCPALVPNTRCEDRPDGVECRAETPAPECIDNVEFESWCNGSYAVTCMAGIRFEIDCGVLPRGECEDYVGDIGERQLARCRSIQFESR